MPLRCAPCPLRATGRGFCPDWVGPAARLFFILKAPGKYEIALRRPLSGGTGGWFERHILSPFDLTWDDVAVLNVIRCYPGPTFPTGKKRQEAVRICRQYDPELPELFVVTYNPANIFRDQNTARFIIRAVEFALGFDQKVCLLCGQEALETFAPELKGGLKKWQRHYFIRRSTTQSGGKISEQGLSR